MEATVALALAEKLRRLYEKDDKFLTYPLGVGFPNKSLGFMKDPATNGLGAIGTLQEKVRFARCLNIVPDDSSLFSADATEFLWDRTLRVIKGAVFAKSGLTDDEEKRLAEATDLLTDLVKLTDGIEVSVNSEILNRYYMYETAFKVAEQQYLNEKITVETSTGPEGDALKARWAAGREQQLKDAMQRALNEFNTLGQANLVRSAMQTKNDLELKKYLNLYREAYLNEIDLADIPDPDAGGLVTYTTLFSPHDVFDQSIAWNQLTLTKTELDALAQSASPALKAVFGTEQGVPIESITLEYTNVAVVRPWFRPEFFASRTWRLADSLMVSDGGSPRSGIIPAYISSMLVTRNITITRPAGAPATPVCIPIIAKEPITTRFQGDQLRNIVNDNPAIQKVVANPVRVKPTATAVKAKVSPTIARVSPNIAKVTAVSTTKASPSVGYVANLSPAIIKSFTTISVQNKADTDRIAEILNAKQNGVLIASPTVRPVPPPPPVSTSPVTQERFALDGVVVLAYVCKRVPLSPNPDPSLPW